MARRPTPVGHGTAVYRPLVVAAQDPGQPEGSDQGDDLVGSGSHFFLSISGQFNTTVMGLEVSCSTSTGIKKRPSLLTSTLVLLVEMCASNSVFGTPMDQDRRWTTAFVTRISGSSRRG